LRIKGPQEQSFLPAEVCEGTHENPLSAQPSTIAAHELMDFKLPSSATQPSACGVNPEAVVVPPLLRLLQHITASSPAGPAVAGAELAASNDRTARTPKAAVVFDFIGILPLWFRNRIMIRQLNRAGGRAVAGRQAAQFPGTAPPLAEQKQSIWPG
jgi:hypothetical protein